MNFRISLEEGAAGEEQARLGDERQERGPQFYPLQELLQEVVQQEKLVWKKTQGVRIPPTGTATLCVAPHELELVRDWLECGNSASVGG